MTVLDTNYFIKAIHRIAEMIEKERDYLTSLDSAVGDGDHGINLSIGFREVLVQLDLLEDPTIAEIFKKTGMTLLGKVGGASGPLYGSLFMKMAPADKSKKEVSVEEFVDMFSAGVDSVISRGKAVLEDKTMVDTLLPAKNYLQEHKAAENFSQVLQDTVEIMKQRSQEIAPLIAKKGRAMRLGERAIDHLDPGAESSWRIVECFYLEYAE
ncbi:TPA: dihydroxyacetone kinase subunit DhaL [Streptococcus suis]